ncbi:MAG TPA: hypothetical protein VF701_20985 [Thermoanaerobaculia bacterium]
MLNWLDRIPYVLLIVVALWLALVPFGQSHLVEKWRMLLSGTLQRPLDWFDLVMHTAPLLLLVVRIIRDLTREGRG